MIWLVIVTLSLLFYLWLSSYKAKYIDDFKIKDAFLYEKFQSLEKSQIIISDLKKDS